MAHELIPSKTISGNSAIATYSRNGLEIPVSPIEQFVLFRKIDIVISKSFACIYPESDLRIVSLQADRNDSNYKIEIFNRNDTKVFSNTYQALVIDPNYILLEKGYKMTVTPIANILALTIVGIQCAILDLLPFEQ
jgi:hypothetical protein